MHLMASLKSVSTFTHKVSKSLSEPTMYKKCMKQFFLLVGDWFTESKGHTLRIPNFRLGELLTGLKDGGVHTHKESIKSVANTLAMISLTTE